MHGWKRLVLFVLILAAIGAGLYEFVFKTLYYTPPERSRSGITNSWFQTGFSVAIVWPIHTDLSLVEGVTLALEEVNAGGGPLAGKIHLRQFNETTTDGSIARDVVQYHDVVAVIGHEPSTASIPASVTYEQHGILFLAPKSTDVRLTSHNFLYTFRLTPDDEELTGALARFAASRKWTRIGVLHQRTDQAESAAEYFVSLGGKSGITVPFVRSFFHDPRWEFQDFRPMLASVRTEMFDAIMLSDELPWAGRLLTDMAKMGVTQPILATDTLDSAQLWNVAKEAANNLYVASAVDPLSKDPAYVGFRDRFRQRFKSDPGYGASQGYETFMLFVKACLLSNSADPVVVATTLRTNRWTELFGEVAFTPEGDVLGRDISIKKMHDGVFETVAVEVEDANQPEEDVNTPEKMEDVRKSPEQVQP